MHCPAFRIDAARETGVSLSGSIAQVLADAMEIRNIDRFLEGMVNHEALHPRCRCQIDTLYRTELRGFAQRGHLETILETNPEYFFEQNYILIIGRQVTTDLKGSIDLLGIDSDGYAVAIELKRGQTLR